MKCSRSSRKNKKLPVKRSYPREEEYEGSIGSFAYGAPAIGRK